MTMKEFIERAGKTHHNGEWNQLSLIYSIEQFSKAASVLANEMACFADPGIGIDKDAVGGYIYDDITCERDEESAIIETFIYSAAILSRYGDPEGLIEDYMEHVGW